MLVKRYLRFVSFAFLVCFAQCSGEKKAEQSAKVSKITIEDRTTDSLEIFIANENEDCIRGFPYYKQCDCSNGKGGTVKKPQQCVDYKTAKGVFCRTECESCYVVCNRP
jgi:hypothetical protein